MVRILLTGASGFLGSHMMRHLHQVRGAEIHAVNRTGTGPTGAIWHAADLRDPYQASGVIQGVRPTHVLHAAWDVTPGKFWNDPGNLDWATGSMQLAAATAAIGGRFVGVGTCAEYDWSGDGVLVEDKTPISPLTTYGRSKAMVWEFVSKLPNAAWGRVFNPYGHGDSAGRLVPSVVDALKRGQPIDLGSGKQVRDFVHAADIAGFFVTLLMSGRTGAFNIGSGVGRTIREVVEAAAEAVDGDQRLLLFGARPDGDQPHSIIADMSKSIAELNWQPPGALKMEWLRQPVSARLHQRHQ